MPVFKDLREFIDAVSARGLVKMMNNADWNLEIGAITEVSSFSKTPTALVFDSIKDYAKGFRVATNLYSTEELQALALNLPENVTGVEQVRSWRNRAMNIRKSSVPPREVSDGVVKENTQKGNEVNVLKFPVPLWHERDGGRFLGTGDAVILRDPEDNWINVGVYRCQIHEKNMIGLNVGKSHHGRSIMEKYWKKGENCPVAVCIGVDPYLYASACAPIPWGDSELEFAGSLKETPVEVINDDQSGLPVPANAEIAILGSVPPFEKESREEGPFGECAGYYADFGPAPILKIREIWHRNDPILQGNPTMRGSAMRHALGAHITTSAAVWDDVERVVPNVKGVYSLIQQCQLGSNMLVISLEQSSSIDSRKAARAAVASKACILTNRMVVTVDEDIDPSNLEEVLFAIMTRCDPQEDVEIVKNTPAPALDPRISPKKRAANVLTLSTMIINACKPYEWKDEYPTVNKISEKLADLGKKRLAGMAS